MKLNEELTKEELTTTADTLLARATRKAMTRLIPMMCLVYFMSYIDRTNVALAKTHLEANLGISAAAYGLGAGLFFLSYAFLEIPSNLTMFKVGPRRWIVRIAITWGVLSGLMMFVQGERSFYLLRFLLGAAEAGLFPSLMYMITIWFAQKHRATAIGFLYLAATIALTVGGPLGGAMMELDGLGGLHGWQWMFMLEGMLTVVVGAVTWFTLPEAPKDARWLTEAEAEILTERAIGATPRTEVKLRGNMGIAFGRPFIIILGLIYMFNQITTIGIIFNIAMARMSGLMAAAGLALINTVGLIGGFVGPYLFGLAETKTGNPSAGFSVVIASSIVGVALALLLHTALRREDAAAALPATLKA